MARDANGKFVGGTVGGTVETANADSGSPDLENPVLAGSETTDGDDGENIGGSTGVDPAAISADRAEKRGTPKRGRGRPPGKTKAKERGQKSADASAGQPAAQENSSSLDPDFVSFVLASIHEMAAKIVKADELKLTDDEARRMSAATLRVAEFYDIRMSAKSQAWAAFGTTCANIYYPRISMIAARKREERKPKSPAPANTDAG